jgi:hypothetical protein
LGKRVFHPWRYFGERFLGNKLALLHLVQALGEGPRADSL